MQTIKIEINKVTKEQIDLIVDCLKNGQVIAYPTDTIYGLGCDAGNAEAIEKINKIKGERGNPPSLKLRRTSKPFVVLISDLEMLNRYCVVSEEQLEYLKTIWGFKIINPPRTPLQGGQSKGATQSPVTVILESRKNLPKELTGGLDSLAVRLPKNEFLVKMISTADFPIVSTSLNKTGEPPLNNTQDLENYFAYLPDLVIDAGECRNIKPSRLVDLRDVKNIKVIRE